jgi:ATP-dependent Lon protease
MKEKLLAALRGASKQCSFPKRTPGILSKSRTEIVPVSRMDEVLARAMTRKPEPIEWDETTTTAAAVPEEGPVEEEALTLSTH